MKKWLLPIVSVVVLVGGLTILWGAFQRADAPGNDAASNSKQQPITDDVRSLVGYTLPAGWQEGSCAGDSTKVYLSPPGTAVNCDADPRAPFVVLVDPRNTTDCQHVTAPNGVLGHTCKTVYVDGRRAVQTVTEYPKSELYAKAETDSYYFIDTGKGVVQVEYIYGAKGSNSYQAEFDQLAQSVKVK